MLNISLAQLPPAGTKLCLDYNDQSAGLGTIWAGLVIVCLALALAFLLLKQKKMSILYGAYLSILLAMRFLSQADECGHGGLFAISSSSLGFYLLVASGVVIIASAVLGGSKYVKQRRKQKT